MLPHNFLKTEAKTFMVLPDSEEHNIQPTQMPWLSEFLHETGIAACDFVAYYADSLSDWGFSDEWIRDNYDGENLEITDALRVSQGRSYLAGLNYDDTYSMFDPGFFDFQVEVSSGDIVTIVIGFFTEGQAGSCFYYMGGFKESASNTLKLVNSLVIKCMKNTADVLRVEL